MNIFSFEFKIDKKEISLINILEFFSLAISIIGLIILYIHLKYFISFDLYDIGTSIFRTGIISGVCSFGFIVFFNAINKGLIHNK